MKKITILIAVCVGLSASAWAQWGPGRGGMGLGMGPGPMGRGPVAGMMLDRPAPSADQIPQTQPQPVPEFNRPKANAQRFQDIPPVVRNWLRNGGWAILREKFAQRALQGQGPRAGMGQGQPMRPGMRMGARGMGIPSMGPGMRSQFGRMAPRGGMGMMQRFGQGGPDQPRDILKFRPEIRKFEGPKDKGDKANSPEAKFQKNRKDKENKAKIDKEPKSKKDKDADRDEDKDR